MFKLNALKKSLLLKQALLVLAIFVTSFALYDAWESPFVLDDMTKIMENPDLQVTTFSIHNFVFQYPESTTQLHNDPSRPLTYFVYWLCWQFGEGHPELFHIVNTFTHALNASLLALLTTTLMLQIFGTYSLFAGAVAAFIFLTSPLMAGTTVYIYGLSDLLSAACILLALFPLVQSRSTDLWRVLFSILFFILALASKQSAVAIPALLMTFDFFTGKILTRERIKRIYIPLISVSVAYVAFRFLYFGSLGDLEGRGSTVPRFEYLFAQGVIILKYIALTIRPVGLTIDHLYYTSDFSPLAKSAAWLAILVATALALRAGLRRDSTRIAKIAGFGWIFYLLCLLPTSSFMPTVDLCVERRAYISDLGLFAVFGSLLALAAGPLWKARSIAITILVAAIALGQSVISRERQTLYASTEALWKESLKLDPLSVRARTNLAVHYSAAKRFEEARILLEELAQDDPSNGGIYSKLGYIYIQSDYEHRNDEVAAHFFKMSLERMPDNVFALYNYGILDLRLQKFSEAERLFKRVIALNPLMALAYVRAGEAAFHLGKRDEAIAKFREALRLNSNLADARQNLQRLGVSE